MNVHMYIYFFFLLELTNTTARFQVKTYNLTISILSVKLELCDVYI